MSSQEEINKGARDICDVIVSALSSDDGALIGRNGTIELECMIYPMKPTCLFPMLEKNAGVFPLLHKNNDIFSKWCHASIEATQYTNVLAVAWYETIDDEKANAIKKAEAEALQCWGILAVHCPLRSLEPYYVDSSIQWTQHLKGHKVAIVSSFTETAKKQVAKLPAIWPLANVLPSDIEWSWVQTGHPPSVAQGRNEWPAHIGTWSDAVNHVVSEVIRTGARFALIGCGGLSMPIAKALKDRGIIAIVLGGAIQVLFGIKGSRWANHDVISKFWNDAWVWPSIEETPLGATGIEGGCYWGT